MFMYEYISPWSSFRWIKDGEDFDPSGDPELKVSERSGSSAFYTLSNTMDSLKQYQGTYICLASNELGTAVSNEAKLKIDGMYSSRLPRTGSFAFKGRTRKTFRHARSACDCRRLVINRILRF